MKWNAKSPLPCHLSSSDLARAGHKSSSIAWYKSVEIVSLSALAVMPSTVVKHWSKLEGQPRLDPLRTPIQGFSWTPSLLLAEDSLVLRLLYTHQPRFLEVKPQHYPEDLLHEWNVVFHLRCNDDFRQPPSWPVVGLNLVLWLWSQQKYNFNVSYVSTIQQSPAICALYGYQRLYFGTTTLWVPSGDNNAQ